LGAWFSATSVARTEPEEITAPGLAALPVAVLAELCEVVCWLEVEEVLELPPHAAVPAPSTSATTIAAGRVSDAAHGRKGLGKIAKA
jgi:hypothetical protein